MFFYSALYTITSMKYGLFHLQYMNILNKTSAVLKQNIARIPPATIARIPPATIHSPKETINRKQPQPLFEGLTKHIYIYCIIQQFCGSGFFPGSGSVSETCPESGFRSRSYNLNKSIMFLDPDLLTKNMKRRIRTTNSIIVTFQSLNVSYLPFP